MSAGNTSEADREGEREVSALFNRNTPGTGEQEQGGAADEEQGIPSTPAWRPGEILVSLSLCLALLPRMAWTVLALCTGSAALLYVLFSWLLSVVQTSAWWALFWHDNFVQRLWDVLTHSTRPQRMLKAVEKKATRGDPESVISTIDHFCKNSEWAMNVGDEKGSILDSVVSEVKPSMALELGTYCGYSTVRIARLLSAGTKFITVEMNPDYATVARQVIAHAGLQDKVTLVVGSSSELIPKMKDRFGITKFDFIFLDHWKDRYLPDIKLLEECGLLRKGSVLLADNVICPGTPDYLDYVRRSPRYKSRYFQSHLEYTRVEDGLEKSVFLG